ncbi:DUF1015 family protein [Alphaproteobacteria bacterium]|nr:DUF1015 family protein [Alphaproteobacteria bacterium]
MVNIWPFHGTRPCNQDAKNLIAPSTDHLSFENIEIFRKNNYWNYLKVLNPVGKLKEKDSLFEAREHFNEMKVNDVIKKDDELNFYIYQIELGNHTQLGFLSLASINDFEKNIIKPHEKIYESRKIERADQMMNLNTQIGPIYVCYPSEDNVASMLLSITKNSPTYDFESFDKSIHRLWCVNNKNFIEEFMNLAKNIDYLYIADGHHRMGAMQYINKINSLNDRFMIAAFPSKECKIFDYNRVIKDLNGLSKEQFIKILSIDFKVLKTDKAYKPLTKNEFGMYHDSQWYILEFINSSSPNNFIDALDINILNNFCLTKMLNIKDVNNDERIRFIAGCHGLSALEKKVDENPDSVAFSIFPSKITDVIRVADNNLTMPPKSTWFDPKPLDGLVVYEFN